MDIQSACLLILTAIAITMTLMHLSAVMVPFVLSLFLYFMVAPAVVWLETAVRAPRWLSVLFTSTFAILSMVFIVFIVATSIRGFLQDLEFYQHRLLETVAWANEVLLGYGLELNLSTLQKEVKAAEVFSLLSRFTGQAMGILGNFFLILVFLLFLLFGQVKQPPVPAVFREVGLKISQYIWTKFLLSLTTGGLVGIILAILEIDLAFMFGLLAFLLNFIPSIGSIVATLLPLPVVILQYGFGLKFALVLAIPGTLQFIIGNVLEPKLMGESLDLHPVTVMFFLIFWGIVWGLPGMFLAVPITAILRFVLAKFDGTQPLAEIMSGRFSPVLQPIFPDEDGRNTPTS